MKNDDVCFVNMRMNCHHKTFVSIHSSFSNSNGGKSRISSVKIQTLSFLCISVFALDQQNGTDTLMYQ